MSRFTSFTKHSIVRLAERSSVTQDDLAKILDAKAYVCIGTEYGCNREHRLIYTIQDRQHYVVIQDKVIGVIVTILPIEYHNNISWEVKQSELVAAKTLAFTRAPEFGQSSAIQDNKGPNKFSVTAIFLEGEQRKCKTLFSFKDEADKPTIVNKPYEMQIRESINELKLTNLLGVSVKNKSSGGMEFYDWSNNALAA